MMKAEASLLMEQQLYALMELKYNLLYPNVCTNNFLK